MKLGRKKFIIIRVCLFLFLMIISFATTISYLYSKIDITNETYIKLLFNDIYGNNFYNTIVEYISNKLNPLELINIEVESKKVNLPNKIDNPKIYIYNENQNDSYMSKYNIKPTIYITTYYLTNKLNKLGINTIFENNDIYEFSKNNNMSINDTLNYFINEKESIYNLKYIINLCIGNDKKVNNGYPNIKLYTNDSNIDFVTKLNKKLNENINNISKIYYTNEYSYIKIDIGSNDNDFNDIKRGIDLLSKSIREVYNE